MKKSLLLLSVAALLAAPAVVFANDGSFVDTTKEATVELHNANVEKQEKAAEEAKLKAGIKEETYVGETPAENKDVYTLETTLADGSKARLEVPFVNNKAVLPDGTVVERPAAPVEEKKEEAPKAEVKKEEAKPAAKAVKPAATKTASKALPKTSAVK